MDRTFDQPTPPARPAPGRGDPRHFDLDLAPLRDLYAAAGRSPPRWRAVPPAEIPEPQRTLLVHERDMTRTLEQFHRDRLRLRVLATRRSGTGTEYWRESALELTASGRVVEFGAIRIFLDEFAEPARAQILGERLPLGAILNQSGRPYISQPSGYFRCDPDAFIRASLGLASEAAGPLYGRQNTLSGPEGRPLAEIVEILPPEPAHEG